ncbi:hypothetical protein J2TS4_52660 [Paenibacillus sp. J2TS4]|nr:hypothetical protein J2TS4_52660 [Paenibacillus sp. J2TS4]
MLRSKVLLLFGDPEPTDSFYMDGPSDGRNTKPKLALEASFFLHFMSYSIISSIYIEWFFTELYVITEYSLRQSFIDYWKYAPNNRLFHRFDHME